jgi:hypothetical protein
MSENLCAAFHCDTVDQSELEQLLLAHFGGSESRNDNEIRYMRGGGGDPALVLKYSKNGAVAEVVAGPSIYANDVSAIVEKIERHLLFGEGLHIGQLVLFAVLPTRGWFRYRDVFQLLPVPPDAPQAPFLVGDHPLLLQYGVKSSGDFQIDMLRRARVGRELELLCTALTTTICGGIGNVVRQHWSLVRGRDPTNWRSEYCQEAYTYPSANGIAPAYTAVKGIEPIAKTSAQTHYTRIGISGGQVLDVPDTFEQSLDVYFGMPREDQERFIRACFWFQFAQRVATLSYSGAFTALVSAVESLMGDARPEGQCDACKRVFGAGPTKRFVEFVDRYAPGPAVSNGHRRQLYSLRSALAHGGHLLHSDRYGWGGGMTADALSEQTDQRALWRAVRLVLIKATLNKSPISAIQ